MKRWLHALWPLLSWIAGILLFGLGIYKWSWVFIGWAVGSAVVVFAVTIVAGLLVVWVDTRLKEHDKAHPDKPGKWENLNK